MSSTTPSASPTPSSGSSSCTNFNFSVFPTNDTACAAGGTAGIPSSYSSAFDKCCKSAPVETWGSDCAKWCLSVDQTVGDLTKCLQDSGVQANQIFCRGNSTATATGKPDKSGGATGSATGSAASTATGAKESKGAAAAVTAPRGVSKAGLGMLTVVLGGLVAGALL